MDSSDQARPPNRALYFFQANETLKSIGKTWQLLSFIAGLAVSFPTQH